MKSLGNYFFHSLIFNNLIDYCISRCFITHSKSQYYSQVKDSNSSGNDKRRIIKVTRNGKGKTITLCNHYKSGRDCSNCSIINSLKDYWMNDSERGEAVFLTWHRATNSPWNKRLMLSKCSSTCKLPKWRGLSFCTLFPSHLKQHRASWEKVYKHRLCLHTQLWTDNGYLLWLKKLSNSLLSKFSLFPESNSVNLPLSYGRIHKTSPYIVGLELLPSSPFPLHFWRESEEFLEKVCVKLFA